MHRYDEIRQMPKTIDNISQTCYRSHHILQAVKDMLKDYYSSEAILDLIGLLEQDLPVGKPVTLESASKLFGSGVVNGTTETVRGLGGNE